MYRILLFFSPFKFTLSILRNQNDKVTNDSNLSGHEIVSFSLLVQVSVGHPEKTANFTKQQEYVLLLKSASLL